MSVKQSFQSISSGKPEITKVSVTELRNPVESRIQLCIQICSSQSPVYSRLPGKTTLQVGMIRPSMVEDAEGAAIPLQLLWMLEGYTADVYIEAFTTIEVPELSRCMYFRHKKDV